MRLKEYQQRVLNVLQEYLQTLHELTEERNALLASSPRAARSLVPPRDAWKEVFPHRLIWHERLNGLGESIADVYFKIPTGGGKTLLACHAIDAIQRIYLERQTGVVVWIVPSTEIYRQTIRALKNRHHPYRQVLDMATGNRVLLREKDERFTRADVEQSLVVLMLMLPSANRENKQSLRVFRDSGGFTDFFPPEDQWAAQEALLEQVPNLDCFGDGQDENAEDSIPILSRVAKTSLGNTLRLCRPLILVDEGHRAWSERARRTIEGLNPCFVLQLSATPPQASNKLVEISGRDLDREQMIKLPVNLQNRRNHTDWKDTMLAAKGRRDELEIAALRYRQQGGKYIRPICLVQAQQTGIKLVNDFSKIHAQHVYDYLVNQCAIPPSHVAVKTNDNDGLEGIDLLAEDCPIRYIITKQALQEGWDCPFAYVLTILSNSGSETGLTQLIGRILRQPYAQDTGEKLLDECYLYTFRQSSLSLAQSIKANLEREGLGEIAGRIIDEDSPVVARQEIFLREKFRHFEGQIYLPKFVVPLAAGGYRDFIYEADILPNIPWQDLDIEPILAFNPNTQRGAFETHFSVNYNEWKELGEQQVEEHWVSMQIDRVFMTRQLGDVIPNPWWGYEYATQILDVLLARYGEEVMAANFIRLIQWAKYQFRQQINFKSREVFKKLIAEKKLFFLLLKTHAHCIPNRIPVRGGNRPLHHAATLQPVQKSLFDPEPEDDYNEEEKAVALFLDSQGDLLEWWHRNRVGEPFYFIKGYENRRTYPDFIAAKTDPIDSETYNHVFVYEYKGDDRRDSPDTRYKADLFDICTRLSWEELSKEFTDKTFTFQMIYRDEYEQIIRGDFSG